MNTVSHQQEKAKPNSAPWQNHPAYRAWVKEFFQALFDFEFHESITVKMLPLLYLVGILASATVALYSIGSAFSRGFWSGILFLFIVSPLIFIFCTAALRSLLEFFSAVFRIQHHIQGLQTHIQNLHGTLEHIQGEMHALAKAVDSVDQRASQIASTVDDVTALFRDFEGLTGKIPFFSKPKKVTKEKNWAESPLPDTHKVHHTQNAPSHQKEFQPSQKKPSRKNRHSRSHSKPKATS